MRNYADLHNKHQFDLARLATSAGVPSAILDRMLSGQPVAQQDALLVLQMASRLTREHYTLENVDALIDEEVQHE